MLEQLNEYLLAVWEQLPGAVCQPSMLSFLAQATGVSKACYFVFADGEPLPRYVVKVPRSPAYNDGLMREVEAIERVRAGVSDELRQTLPGPMHRTALAGHIVVIEPVLPGCSMDALFVPGKDLSPSVVAAQMSLAREWLVHIQLEMPHQKGPLDAFSVQEHFVEPLERMRRQTSLTESEGTHLERVRKLAQRLVGEDVPLYLYHGDLRPGNILVDGARIAVLDWEFSRPLAPPLLDWFSFVFRLYSRTTGLPDIDGSLLAYRQAFWEVFFASGWFCDLVADQTRMYCEALGVPGEHLPLLFSIFVVTNVNKFHGFLAERVDRGYLYLLQNATSSGLPHLAQLRRQAYAWLWGDLAENWESLALKG